MARVGRSLIFKDATDGAWSSGSNVLFLLRAAGHALTGVVWILFAQPLGAQVLLADEPGFFTTGSMLQRALADVLRGTWRGVLAVAACRSASRRSVYGLHVTSAKWVCGEGCTGFRFDSKIASGFTRMTPDLN